MNRTTLAFVVGGLAVTFNSMYTAIIAAVGVNSPEGVVTAIAILGGVNSGIAALASYLQVKPSATEAELLDRATDAAGPTQPNPLVIVNTAQPSEETIGGNQS